MFYSGGTEHETGMVIVKDQDMGKTVKGYWTLSDRVLLLKIEVKPMELEQ